MTLDMEAVNHVDIVKTVATPGGEQLQGGSGGAGEVVLMAMVAGNISHNRIPTWLAATTLDPFSAIRERQLDGDSGLTK